MSEALSIPIQHRQGRVVPNLFGCKPNSSVTPFPIFGLKLLLINKIVVIKTPTYYKVVKSYLSSKNAIYDSIELVWFVFRLLRL